MAPCATFLYGCNMSAGVTFFHPIQKPVSSLLLAMPLSSYLFTVSGSPTTQARVYHDAFLDFPFNGNPVADEAGNFRPIYLDPRVHYRVQLIDVNGVVQYTLDPYLPPCPTTGTGPIQINQTTGEVVINAPLVGGNAAALQTVKRNFVNTYAISCPGNVGSPNAPLLQFLNTLTTGSQTANTAAVANKPGAVSASPTSWLPILGDGGITYYIPMWS